MNSAASSFTAVAATAAVMVVAIGYHIFHRSGPTSEGNSKEETKAETVNNNVAEAHESGTTNKENVPVSTSVSVPVPLPVSVPESLPVPESVPLDLHALALSGSEEELARLLAESPTSISVRDDNNDTLLLSASRGGHESLVKQLLSLGLCADDANKSGDTAVVLACRIDHLNIVKILEGGGANMMHILENGDNLLHVSLRTQSDKVVTYLLEQHAELLGGVNHDGLLPLQLAVVLGLSSIVQQIISHSPSAINSCDITSSTSLLHLACEHMRNDIAVQLVMQGCSLDARNASGLTPIDLLPRQDSAFIQLLHDNSNIHFQIKNNNLEAVKKLLQSRRERLELLNEHGKSPLHTAYRFHRTEIVRYLLDCGARQRRYVTHPSGLSGLVRFE